MVALGIQLCEVMSPDQLAEVITAFAALLTAFGAVIYQLRQMRLEIVAAVERHLKGVTVAMNGTYSAHKEAAPPE